jgi:dTDP-4-dehydrorhamnose reductase
MSIAKPIALVIGTGQLGQELARVPTSQLLVKVAGRDSIDVTDAPATLSAIRKIRPAIVLNAAAYTVVDKAETEPAAAFAVNRDGAAALATACAELGIPLIHVSTDYVFDGDNGPYTETSVPAPRSVYGDSKLQGEIEIGARLEHHIILRTAWLFSAFGNNFVKTMLRLSATRPEIQVVDDQVGCPTPAAALAQAMVKLAETSASGSSLAWGTYHFAGQPSTTWRRFAEHIFARAAAIGLIDKAPDVNPITTAQYPTAARRPANSVLNCDALAKLGLAVPDWRNGLDAVLDELRLVAATGSVVR